MQKDLYMYGILTNLEYLKVINQKWFNVFSNLDLYLFMSIGKIF